MAVPKDNIPPLTRAEEAVMKALWLHESAFVKDIIQSMPAHRPHANTVNTVLKILAEKGFVVSEPMGNANRFRALISREAYSRRGIAALVKGYFNGSFTDMVSFFVAEKDMDISDLEQVLEALKKQKK